MTMNEFINKVQYFDCYDVDALYRFCHNCGLDMHNGASRCAVLFPKEKQVIKIPRMNDCKTNYCDIEARNYEIAKKYRVEKVLLPLEFLTETKAGCLFYVQPMYSFAQCEMKRSDALVLEKHLKGLTSRPIVDKVRRGCVDRAISRTWTARMVQLYGKKFARSFEEWTKECQVNDLHSSNIGWLNGRPIILDYAGFHGSGSFDF